MFSYLDAGFTTWDLADHYGPAEDFIGEFRRRLADRRGGDTTTGIQAFTKWVHLFRRSMVRLYRHIHGSCRRLAAQ